jgi:SAM-dependent methyltransferase
MAGENDVVIAASNSVLFDNFSRFKHLPIDGVSAHSDEAFARHLHPEGARVLDAGCGFGDSAIRIAKRAGPGGEVLGVDCAENFICFFDACRVMVPIGFIAARALLTIDTRESRILACGSRQNTNCRPAGNICCL